MGTDPIFLNVALPEGASLRVSDSTVELRGPYPPVHFIGGKPLRRLMPGKLPPLFGDSA
jgi:hypothetical protein